MKLEDTLGKTIGDFCLNGFKNSSDNHCAHFVCHVLEVSAGYNCKVHTGKPHPGSCLRVHELFDVCPVVGKFADHPGAPCIAFVTAKGNVDLENHTMRNVPQKHVGIFDGTHVYNYSNGADKVVRQTPKDFLARFEAIYTGTQALFFGTMPVGAKLPGEEAAAAASREILAMDTGVEPPAAALAQRPVLAIRTATNGGMTEYHARIDGGNEYFVGRSVPYSGFRGLFQPPGTQSGPVYQATDFAGMYGTVAGLLGVIAAGESKGRFNCINSYDRAAFTFGFFQLAAHTPNDNLILLFRRLAQEHDGFRNHFPDLSVREGKLHRQIGENQRVSLEKEYPRPGNSTELNLKDFMAYLNSDPKAVDQAELEAAARLISLAGQADFNTIQVSVAAEITLKKMRLRYDKWYGLDGQSDLICTAIADIHHQGRGSRTQVKQAIASGTVAQKVAALCEIGKSAHPERCATLKSALAKAKQDGLLGISIYDSASGLFRPSDGWPG